MRTISNWLYRRAIAAVIAAISMGTAAHAGFMDLLRGDPASNTVVAQRVAFVGTATVKEVQGRAEKLVGIDSWEQLRKGVELAPGDIIRTQEGTVMLHMVQSGSFVKMTPHTVLRLLRFEKGWDPAILSGREDRKGFIVRSCRGRAFARSAGSEWESVTVNSVLTAGCEVRTEPGAVVDLFNTDKRQPVRIPGSSYLKLNDALLASRVHTEPALVAVGGR